VTLSKTHIDKLGERLKARERTEIDLRELDEYRRSFGQAYENGISTASQFGHKPTGRIKSNASIVAKLQRESIRLTQIQDIAGCRIVVANSSDQNLVVLGLTDVNRDATVIDRRDNPSHGYRAIHVIVRFDDRSVEIQVRSELQHRWAEVSEKYSDVIDPAIKYGGGDRSVQDLLLGVSSDIAEAEDLERSDFEGALYVEEGESLESVLWSYKEHAHARLDALMQQLNNLRGRARE